MKVIELIEKRNSYGFGNRIKDEWFEEVAHSNKDRVAIILTESTLSKYTGENKESVVTIREKYNLSGMFDIGNPLPNTNVKLVLYVFDKKPVEKIAIGVYQESITRKRTRNNEEIVWNKLYPIEYCEYIEAIDNWFSTGIIPEDTDYYEFNNIEKSMLKPDIYVPKRYTKKVYAIFDAIKNEKVLSLKDAVDIIIPRPDENKKNRAEHYACFNEEYPLTFKKTIEGINTDSPIRKNDIIFMDLNHMTLVDTDPDREIHVSPNVYILRPKQDMSPYYLYLYLKSDTARIILDSFEMGSVYKRIKRQDLSNIPVVQPVLGMEEQYYEAFKLQYYRANNIIEFIPQNKALNVQHRLEKLSAPKINDIISEEWAKKIQVCKKDAMKKFLEADIHELNICYRNKAYKATIILAGSILEAILIDWLIEIKGGEVDYFKKRYTVKAPVWDNKKKCYKKDKNGDILYKDKDADLKDYINEVEKLAKPKWMKAHDAHIIRDRRNWVHAKLCMKDDVVINEKTCREVIDYLIEVIKTRGIEVKNNL